MLSSLQLSEPHFTNEDAARGFVASFPRPGGNVAGFINFEPTIAGKWLELLKEIAPRVNRVAFLFNPATATYAEYFLNLPPAIKHGKTAGNRATN